MNSSLKIGAVSGLIAGFVFGIVDLMISVPLVFGLGILPRAYPPILGASFTRIAAGEFIISLFLGAIFGAIYSRVYRVIPGKPVVKGLLFGLFGILTFNIYFATIFLPYLMIGVVGNCLIWAGGGPAGFVAYGLVLGLLYEFLRSRYQIVREEPEIIKYSMRGGVLPGAIAGILGGAGSFVAVFLLVYFGVWPIYPRHLIDIVFILSQLGTQIMVHLIPGTYLGAIYPRVYNLVPGKGILKGLSYGLIVSFLFSEVRAILYCLSFWDYVGAVDFVVAGGATAIVYGLVLGALYKK